MCAAGGRSWRAPGPRSPSGSADRAPLIPPHRPSARRASQRSRTPPGRSHRCGPPAATSVAGPRRRRCTRKVSENLEGWLVWRNAAERPVPGYVEEELRGYLECGILCFGCARALCTGCGRGFVVAFSCKGRGVCPSCNGRHMAQTAAHLADHVIPPVPVRQWVISVPKRLRGMLADRPASDRGRTRGHDKAPRPPDAERLRADTRKTRLQGGRSPIDR